MFTKSILLVKQVNLCPGCMSLVFMTTQELICTKIPSPQPWHSVCMMKVPADHVGVESM